MVHKIANPFDVLLIVLAVMVIVFDNTYDCDVGVIWSVPWNGRMAQQKVWDDFRTQ